MLPVTLNVTTCPVSSGEGPGLIAVAQATACGPASSRDVWFGPGVNDGAWFGPDRIDSVSGADPVQLLASVTVAVKVNDPDAVGVPASTPAAESDIPPGSVPADRLHDTGAVPPVCVKVTGA